MVFEEENYSFRDDKEGENPGLGCALETFSEYGEVMDLIEKLKSIYRDRQAMELSAERLIYILDHYQEQPHLLDPYLDSMLNSIINIIRDEKNEDALKYSAFGYIKHIMKVRGYKTVVRHLPHEVHDLEPVLQMLENLNRKDTSLWETSYVLLLWLSIIVKVPFHMSRFDDYTMDDSVKPKSVAERILDICKEYISHVSFFNVPAGYLTAHFITRCDIHKVYLQDFLEWIYKSLDHAHEDRGKQEVNCVNSLAALAAILKHGEREGLLPFAPRMLNKICETNLNASKNTWLRKYGMIIVQRIGLLYLKPKVAAWRYMRGNRSLADTLKAVDSTNEDDAGESYGSSDKNEAPRCVKSDEDSYEPESKMAAFEAESAEAEAEEFYVPDEIEDIIEYLLQGLRDSETVIRWSAAKGIGRVTGRLPRELADEVVESVLELLSPNEQDGAWHGGCLTLAELGRRGLLLPQRLPVVVPVLLRALVYEDSRGYYSTGDHVRDAACYVAWSFARAYEPNVLKPYVNAIASGLLIVSLFDREVKCRRAASAAFQENVGRQGTFPHGIEIVTAADYFSVGIRQNSFLKISVFVAQFEEYTVPLIDHLVHSKVDHWDAAIRELTAEALFKMTPLKPDYVLESVIGVLLKKTKSIDLNSRHGAILALAEVVHALKLLGRETGPDVNEELKQLVYYYQDRNYFGGVGGEILRQGFCRFIEKCSLSRIPLGNEKVVESWERLLNECLLSEVSVIRAKAVSALNPFLAEYYGGSDEESIRVRDAVVDRYIGQVSSLNQTARLGFSSAIGNFPRFMLATRINDLVSAFLKSLEMTDVTSTWADSRREILKALISVVSTVGIESLCNENEFEADSFPPGDRPDKKSAIVIDDTTVAFPVKNVREIFKGLLRGLNDYTTDSRGDVGAWVREASMSGLERMIILIAKWRKELLNRSLMEMVVGGLGKQAVERIDRTRFLASKIFSSILYHKDPVIPNIPHYEELLEIFPESYFATDFLLQKESESFPRFVRMLAFPCYTYSVMEGFIVSIGGITERLVKYSSLSLFVFLKSIEDASELNRLCDTILEIFLNNLHNNRITIPLFTFLDRLLGSGAVGRVLEDPESKFADELLRLTKLETAKVKDFKKFMNSLDVYCQLVQVRKGRISTSALCQMTIFLCHKFKSVRRGAASKLYDCLVLYGDSSVPADNYDDIMTILSDTSWEEEPGALRPVRNRLCELMNLPKPRLKVE